MLVIGILQRMLRRYRAATGSFLALIRPRLVYGLSFGPRCKIHDGVLVRVVDGGKCAFGRNVSIGRFCEITAGGGSIVIDDDTSIGQGSVVVAKQSITIGRDCLVAEHVTIRDQDHRIVLEQLYRNSGFRSAPVEIGDNVWIGAKACILAGVKVGSGSVIGAGAILKSDVPPNAVVAGNPARVVRWIGESV